MPNIIYYGWCEYCDHFEEYMQNRNRKSSLNCALCNKEAKKPPTKYRNKLINKNQEEKNMNNKIVTIIGSTHSKESKTVMKKCKEFWENQGYTVNYPLEMTPVTTPLCSIMRKYIDYISEAEFIIAIPKHSDPLHTEGCEYEIAFGESTSYEIAIANYFGKPVIIWHEAPKEVVL